MAAEKELAEARQRIHREYAATVWVVRVARPAATPPTATNPG